HGRLTARARSLDAHFDVLHAVVERHATGLFGGDLGGERRGLARTAETGATCRRPGKGIALAIGDGDDGVVERGLDMDDAVRDHALDLLLGLGSCRLAHRKSPLLLDGATRALAGACIGTGT